MDDIIGNELTSQSSEKGNRNKSVAFSIEGYKKFSELPLEVLNELPYAVYVIDYNWTYLFLNNHSRALLPPDMSELLGTSALDVFKAPKFRQIFDAIRDGVENRFTTTNTIYSPMRGAQILLKGIPLEDSYFFSAVTLPGKDDLLHELRSALNRKK